MYAIANLLMTHKVKVFLLILWCTIIVSQSNAIQIIAEYFGFLFLGIVGAIFANSTGAGGGVVFVPFFNQLSLSNHTIIATSFAIQCCGMTAGAITWTKHFKQKERNNPDWAKLPQTVMLTAVFSVLGIWVTQYGFGQYTQNLQASLHLGFGIFSILLALAIYASIPLLKRQQFANTLLPLDYILLSITALIGGIITAWLSVGVGELIAVYLILRGFSITYAIAVAVILSAFTVWSAIPFHLFVSKAIYWQILLFAGAGAILGGLVAKHLVMRFSIVKLKIFFASWVMIMGIAGLPIFN